MVLRTLSINVTADLRRRAASLFVFEHEHEKQVRFR
jgi:hypothetical protein